jgi:hypothetical protein
MLYSSRKHSVFIALLNSSKSLSTSKVAQFYRFAKAGADKKLYCEELDESLQVL